MMKSAVRAEDALLTAERQLQERDAKLTVEIRLATSKILAMYLIMEDLVEFTRLYPDIDLNVLISYDSLNLSRREADVALRIMRLGSSPPEDLVGRKLVTIKNCYYASAAYLAENDPGRVDSKARWIGWDDIERFPAWVKASPFPNLPVSGKLNDVMLQAEAARCGLGLTVLPCFFGDSVEGLRRIPNCEPYLSYDLWMLTHPDLRDAARMRTFRAFAVDVINRKRAMLAGELEEGAP